MTVKTTLGNQGQAHRQTFQASGNISATNVQDAIEELDSEKAGTTHGHVDLEATGKVTLSGVISPAQITSNQNDYAPTGFSGARALRLTSDASRNITGIAGGTPGREIVIANVGSNDIVLKDADAGSTAANRFALSADLTLGADTACQLRYDGTSSRWRAIGVYTGAGVGDMAAATYDPAGIAEQLVGLTAAQTLTNKTLTSPVLNTGLSGTAFLDEDNMASDAADKAASQQSIKAYADTKLAIAQNLADVNDAATAFGNIKQAASDSATGVVELATAAETTTGTDTGRAVTPDGLAGSDFGKQVVSILVFDDSADVATGDGAGDVFWRVPATLNGYDLVAVAAHVQTAGTTGTTDIQIHNVTQAADMLSTKLTIDSAEKDSSTAAAAAVIDTANDDVATGDEIRIDVDAVSTTEPKGLVVELTFQLP